MYYLSELGIIFGVLGYLLSCIKGFEVPLIAILTVNIIILSIYFILKGYIPRSKPIGIIIAILIFTFCVYSLIVANKDYKGSIEINVLKNFIFIINIYLTSGFIYLNNKKKFFIKSSYIIISVFLIICYFYNFDKFQGIKSLTLLFDNSLRYRNAYGLYHVNTAGYLCMLSLILYSFVKKYYNLKSLNKYLILNILVLNILLSTSSRNSIICLALFYLGKMFLEFSLQFKSNKYFKVFKYSCISAVSILVLYLIKEFMDMYSILYETNRLYNFQLNIPSIFDMKKQFTGIGLLDESMFVNYQFPFPTTFIDNWYLYIFLTLGFIGLGLISILLFYLCKRILFDKFHERHEKVLYVMFLSTGLFHSLFETSFFMNGVLLSYILWNLYFIFIFEQKYKYSTLVTQ